GRVGSFRSSSGERRHWSATVPSSRTSRSRLLVPGSAPATRKGEERDTEKRPRGAGVGVPRRTDFQSVRAWRTDGLEIRPTGRAILPLTLRSRRILRRRRLLLRGGRSLFGRRRRLLLRGGRSLLLLRGLGLRGGSRRGRDARRRCRRGPHAGL